MSEFDELEKNARAYAEDHPEQADKAISEVADFAERETDHQHDEQIDRAADAAEQHLSQGHDHHEGHTEGQGGQKRQGDKRTEK
jgi:MT0933-like antitoxin protein